MRNHVFAMLAVSLCLATVAAAADSPGVKQPPAGVYAAEYYVKSASATGGGTCDAPVGTVYFGYFTYPGAAKTGAIDRDFYNGAGGNFIQEIYFPTTPAAGATSWSGSYTGALNPGNVGAVTGTFSTVFGFNDTSSFVATTTYVYPVAGGATCTTAIQGSYVKTGK